MTGTRPAPELPDQHRSALLIATGVYRDPELARLRAPAQDAADLAEVLGAPSLGGFGVTTLVDPEVHALRIAVDDFLSGRGPGEVVVVYLSCHGLLDARRRLYFAATDTNKARLPSTSLDAQWLLERLDDCRARRQILILDCCFSGAFARVKGGKGSEDITLDRHFGVEHGRGRVVLTASRATEYSFEGEPLNPSGTRSGGGDLPVQGSVFTSALVDGLRTGKADKDGDGFVSVSEAYAYAYAKVREAGEAQTPQQWLYGGEGEVFLTRSPLGVRVDRPQPKPAPQQTRMPPTWTWMLSCRHPVRAVAFSPDGSLLASAGKGGSVQLWNPQTRQETGSAIASARSVQALAFSPDGALLAEGGFDRKVYLWRPDGPRSLQFPHLLRSHQTLGGRTGVVFALAFSPDGSLLAAGGRAKTVRLWNPHTREPVGEPLTGHTKYVIALAFSPDGTLLATASTDKTVRLWDPRTGKPVGEPLAGIEMGSNGLAFSPDGSLLVNAGGYGEGPRMWDPRTGRPVSNRFPGYKEHTCAIAFSPDGALLATAGTGKTIRLWNPRTGQPVGQPLTGHKGAIHSLAFSSDGSILASGSIDATIGLWGLPASNA
ncbi:caspase family protein [Catenulispora sp. NF23]|uniref:Caspase family protein n=1 Tax=Catenulispora pinistramenti TaxID=2705254 RepID=A0ABS5KW75_9ACTN|nr:caspase family protein [Catenulispora pinistramenti]MBS2537243.1 caspase family protein [Catenulispora pinistramenti]MBS2550326.1 caspase family protein [Catenulispora pinistramenti]